LAEKQPVIFVDAKKGIGRRFPQQRARISPQGNPEEVRVHDFLIK
jgi:hypothetical protein